MFCHQRSAANSAAAEIAADSTLVDCSVAVIEIGVPAADTVPAGTKAVELVIGSIAPAVVLVDTGFVVAAQMARSVEPMSAA